MDPDTLSRILSVYFTAIGPAHKIKAAFLYGSYATGKAHPASDVDLALVFEPGTSTENKFSAIVAFTQRLNALLEKDVNIISVEDDFPKPMLYYSAIIYGKLLFAKEMKHVFDLRMRAIQQMEDFSLFGPFWQHQVTRQILMKLREGTHA